MDQWFNPHQLEDDIGTGPGSSGFDSAKLLDDERGSALIAALDHLLDRRAWHTGDTLRLIPASSALRSALEVYQTHRARRLLAIRQSEDRVQEPLARLRGLLHHWTQEKHWFVQTARARHATTHLLEAFTTLEAEYEAAGGLHEVHAPLECPDEERTAIAQFFENLLADALAYRRSGRDWMKASGLGVSIPVYSPAESSLDRLFG